MSKNGKFSPDKINTLRIYFIRNWRFYGQFFQEFYYTIVFLNINDLNFEFSYGSKNSNAHSCGVLSNVMDKVLHVNLQSYYEQYGMSMFILAKFKTKHWL